MPAPQEVGCRVQILKDRATVKYIGPVKSQEGVWVGVEWDDASRGKHDGSTGGVQYFTTTKGPTAGSFVRVEKVNFGVDVAEALKARYNNQRGEMDEVSHDEMYVHTVRQRKVQIQVVGVEKIQKQQSQTHLLTSARLVGANISHVVSHYICMATAWHPVVQLWIDVVLVHCAWYANSHNVMGSNILC